MLLARGVKVLFLFLPAYSHSPDLSPIENAFAFAKLKAFLRRVRAQTVEALIGAIALALDSISPYDADALGFLVNAGFLNLDQ